MWISSFTEENLMENFIFGVVSTNIFDVYSNVLTIQINFAEKF